MDTSTIISNLQVLSSTFSEQRTERLARRSLDSADFTALAKAGFSLCGLPEAEGGVWKNVEESTRSIAEMVRTIALGDPSVGLVAAMHPCVLSLWLAAGEAPDDYQLAWNTQRDWVFDTVKQGNWWGTVTSEPGSGGDIMKTRSKAIESDASAEYLLSGEKHFGTGSGLVDFMITTATVAGVPDLFVLAIKNAKWDGSEGVKLAAEWDGHGMCATQSHAFVFSGVNAKRGAWPGSMQRAGMTGAQLANTLFSAVIVAVVQQAMEFARNKLASKCQEMRPYEQVEWVRAENDAWMIEQAYAGILNAVESGNNGLIASARGKTVIAELAETCLGRMSKVVGGASYSKAGPLGRWAQDVRALGFLRPPWGLAYDQLFGMSWPD